MSIFSFLGFAPASVSGNAHNFSFRKNSGEELPLSDFAGKVVLVVNTASACGFTNQYAGMEELYQKYKDRGFTIIAVPSNDFGAQEKGSDEEIKNFCDLNFNISFPLAAKEQVSGDEAHAFYRWAGVVLGFGTKPKWNFHKYLIDANGNLVNYFHSTTSPTSEKLCDAIESLLP